MREPKNIRHDRLRAAGFSSAPDDQTDLSRELPRPPKILLRRGSSRISHSPPVDRERLKDEHFQLHRDNCEPRKKTELKNERHGGIREYAAHFKSVASTPVDHLKPYNPIWSIKADCAFPSATQNEKTCAARKRLSITASHWLPKARTCRARSRRRSFSSMRKSFMGLATAANAGGVATSGLEMSQNSRRRARTREEVDDRLHKIMIAIHKNCYESAEAYGTPGNLVNGANIAG